MDRTEVQVVINYPQKKSMIPKKIHEDMVQIFSDVVVMPRTILPRRNRCALSAAGTRKPDEEKDTRGVICFMEENVISLREVARFDEHKRD